jgi:trehalose 6-phosphate phosphatase
LSRTAVEVTVCARFFESVAAAKNRILLVDYDGTLAPFCADRQRAIPYPSVPELLHQIMASCQTRLVIVSGRSAHTVAPLLRLDPQPETWGTYGLERLHADGRYEGPEVTDEALYALGQVEVELQRENLGKVVEARPGAVSVHWRGLPAAQVLEVRTIAYRIMNPLALQTGLLVADFDGGVEIRLRSANKGDIVRTILSEVDSAVPVAYLGDDSTDEDAFRVLNGRGLTVLVRRKQRFTAAQMWLRPPQQLVEFLGNWIKSSRGETPE